MFHSSRNLKTGYSGEPQTQAQYSLLNDPSTSFPTDKLDVPLDLPTVPIPAASNNTNQGSVKVQPGSVNSVLHLDWTDTSGQVDFSGNVTKVGGDERIDLNGAYLDRELTIAIADVGKGPKRSLVGTVSLSGVKYKLKGLRVWGRGTFTLFSMNSDDAVGKGWIEWDPSTKFGQAMKSGKPQPTDQIMSFVQVTKNGFTDGATHLLTRTSQ